MTGWRRALLLGLWFASGSAVAADPHSYADPAQARVRHVELDLTADFKSHTLNGHAVLTVQRVAGDARELRLDTRDLELRAVTLLAGTGKEQPLEYRLGARDPLLGSALVVALPDARETPGELEIRIDYRTSPSASALQWLEPVQTAGSHPYVYSQGQSIHTRSWVPIQDSPGIRMTYAARLQVPADLVAVMSAARVETQGAPRGEFRFEMRQPVPAYLIAFAIGDLAFRALGERTGVWTEPPRLDAAANEFADLPKMVDATERLFGPYRWQRYDLLVMPSSFPYGGMENPRLSFISPSIIAGDRSLVSVITHELAHSWSGNLVTSSTWNDFWLNEGVTTYIERRVVEEIYGLRRAQMEQAIGAQRLEKGIADLKTDGRARDTALVLDLAGRDPDDGSGDVGYEKGSLFLSFLEQRFGRKAFDAFLQDYFSTHAFGSVDSAAFRAFLEKRLAQPGAPTITSSEIDEWLHGEGWPRLAPPIPSDVFSAVDRARDDWLAGRTATRDLPTDSWVTQEWLRFLDGLPADLANERMAELQHQFGFGAGGNAEVARSWLALVVRTAYAPAHGDLARFLTSTGRSWLIVGLYRDLSRTPQGLELGRSIFATARSGYHESMRRIVGRILKLENDT